MTNEELIAQVAISAGIYTVEEIEGFLSEGKEIPLHTLKGWESRGYKVKSGEHGLETKLWKKKKNHVDDDTDAELSEMQNKAFYLTKAFLFSADQIEKMEA